jgi:predicted enzyme related to lactoylglutathione lyase
MAEFTAHVPGTFSWAELATTDQKNGVQFYRTLFGWEVKEEPIGPDDIYSIFLTTAAQTRPRDLERS